MKIIVPFMVIRRLYLARNNMSHHVSNPNDQHKVRIPASSTGCLLLSKILHCRLDCPLAVISPLILGCVH